MKRRRRRAFATLLALWIIAVAVVMLAVVQVSAYQQAAAGREAMARVRAYWAARAGVEATLAAIEDATENPDELNAFATTDTAAELAQGSVEGGVFLVSHEGNTGETVGVQDAHAKLNVNLLATEDLMLLPGMTEDVADAIQDWIDTDEDVRPLGAENSYYLSTAQPYEARNDYFRSIAELELVAGASPELVRGEDWNLNGRLDPNEDDGSLSWPPDNSDGKLDAGWSAILTASSVDGGLGASGEARLDLLTATAEQVAERIGVDAPQSEAIVEYAQSSGAVMSQFIRRNLDQLAVGQGNNASFTAPAPLSNDQLALLFAECAIGENTARMPGKLNVNTCEAEALQYLSGIPPELADSIIAERSALANGFTSIINLLEVPGMTRNQLARISSYLDVRSNVYIVSSRGRDAATGAEVELVATIDRSTLPAAITEFRTQ